MGSAMHVTVVLAILLACSCGATRLRSQKPATSKTGGKNISLAEVPANTYAKDCWQKRRVGVSLAQKETNPGAGIDDFTPFETVEKDGYMLVDCALDEMFVHGDKLGKNAEDYTLGDSQNVSIVHYSDHVGAKDRQDMSPTVCFEFCRTVPGMLLFGITGGTDCYCTPHYKAMESDSSECDMTCVGEPTLFCGGKTKSSMFSMHFCDSTGKDLKAAIDESRSVIGPLGSRASRALRLAKKMQDAGESGQANFGKMGDVAASNLFKTAKTFAGEMAHFADDSLVIRDKLRDFKRDADKSKGDMDFSKPGHVTKAEQFIENMKELVPQARLHTKNLDQFLHAASPDVSSSKEAIDQYSKLMHFVDAKFEDVPTTCSGEPLGKPIVGKSRDECAYACDASTGCVGFAFFGGKYDDGEVPRLCFLFSRFTSAVYYTGCDSKRQVKTACLAKLARFQGTTLKPQEGGQCKNCLKELTKSDQCA
eukprot:gnl/TRDRNA2_/TRDRNA2_179404_c0_seq1.p1 gnl/TRDRNA2_/TRDRNA2_179404_c0~~gnl/TRDRNA2_/TRDRNA2_179404_c0_seq1.p1  ORF type:complete len:478 (-),score=77.32 gnl/TRDRNA2_/TRDRNA2_179404_c0_seq1:258-1691(-)